MGSKYDTYTSTLSERNASPEMLRLWSQRHRFNTWRRIWLAVAEAQHELTCGTARGAADGSRRVEQPHALGTSNPPTAVGGSTNAPLVTREQVEELRAVVERKNADGTVGITDAEIQNAENYERELRHDVMAQVHALGDSCPKARPIIHLGMTSQDVVCNADLVLLWEAQRLVASKLARTIVSLGDQAAKSCRIPALGFTHYQPAQPVTVGRRLALWAHDLSLCLQHLLVVRDEYDGLPLKGLKGATGTQASFLALLGEHRAVDSLDIFFRKYLPPMFDPFDFRVVGQTYPRVIDTFILADLASTASVLHKIATDIRLLCNRKELDEPFESKQIGSSAMPYKRNPMRCERICGLSRFVMNLVGNAYDTAATQWLERTLDDSSNRRLSLPEAFLALDGALDLMHNVASGLIVHEAMVRKNLMAELPFLATENILMECVKLGGDRQEYHEKIRVHAQAAGMRVKQEGLDNDLIERLKGDAAFHAPALKHELNWQGLLDPMKYIGRSVEQTERFIKEVVEPLREQYGEAIAKLGDSSPRV